MLNFQSRYHKQPQTHCRHRHRTVNVDGSWPSSGQGYHRSHQHSFESSSSSSASVDEHFMPAPVRVSNEPEDLYSTVYEANPHHKYEQTWKPLRTILRAVSNLSRNSHRSTTPRRVSFADSLSARRSFSKLSIHRKPEAERRLSHPEPAMRDHNVNEPDGDDRDNKPDSREDFDHRGGSKVKKYFGVARSTSFDVGNMVSGNLEDQGDSVRDLKRRGSWKMLDFLRDHSKERQERQQSHNQERQHESHQSRRRHRHHKRRRHKRREHQANDERDEQVCKKEERRRRGGNAKNTSSERRKRHTRREEHFSAYEQHEERRFSERRERTEQHSHPSRRPRYDRYDGYGRDERYTHSQRRQERQDFRQWWWW